MNSRGTLISQRISGDTLANKDSVAMTPTVPPAAAGTHRYREFDRLLEREVASVTDREDIPSNREMPDEAPRVVCRADPGFLLKAARIASATIPASARDS